jgi:hypothetical protein
MKGAAAEITLNMILLTMDLDLQLYLRFNFT